MIIPLRDYNSTMTVPETVSPMSTEDDFLAYYDAHAAEIDDDILDEVDELFDVTSDTLPAMGDFPEEYFIQVGCRQYCRDIGIMS